MRTILIALVTVLVTLMVACGSDAEEVVTETEKSQTTAPGSISGSIRPETTIGEIPTPVAPSWEATPVPTSMPEPETTPSSLPSGTYVPTPKEISAWERLTVDSREAGDKVLVDTDQYRIVYLISNRQVSVTIKATPFEESKLAAEEWFESQGLSPQSLCVLVRINFVTSQEFADSDYEYKSENSVPTGCDVPNS